MSYIIYKVDNVFDDINRMKKYQIKNTVGSGNFSVVYRAQDVETHEIYAVKVMKTHPKIAIREAHFLHKMKHPNVIELIQFEQSQEQSKLVLEHVGINTLELYESHTYGLREEQVKCILFQAALGLAYIHSFGIIHRDIKPENLLIDKKNALVKIIDFGLAISDKKISTDYIATRWYRAPENLLTTKEYTTAIDVFSLGCVIVELYLGSPLFPGSNNLDQLYKIFNILGEPTVEKWSIGYKKMLELGIKANTKSEIDIDLTSILNPCDDRLINLIHKMLALNPKDRITCEEIIKHDYFKDIKNIIPPAVFKRYEADYGKKSHDPLTFRGFHQLKHPKTSIKQTVQSLANQRKGQTFRSQEHLRKNEKSTSITSNHSIHNNMNILHKSKPSVIRSVGAPGQEQDSLHLPNHYALKKDGSSKEYLTNKSKNISQKSKLMKNQSYVGSDRDHSMITQQMDKNKLSKNSTEDASGQRQNILKKLDKSHEEFQIRMNNKIQEIKAKRALENQKANLISRQNYQKPALQLRTDRSPTYEEQIKNLQAPKLLRFQSGKDGERENKISITPKSLIRNHKLETKKNQLNQSNNHTKNFGRQSPTQSNIQKSQGQKKIQHHRITISPTHARQNKLASPGGEPSQRYGLNHYRSYENLRTKGLQNFGLVQSPKIRKSPEHNSHNYMSPQHKYYFPFNAKH